MKNFIKLSLIIIIVLSITFLAGCKSSDYKEANKLFASKKYSEALEIYTELGDYENSKTLIRECKYRMLLDYIRKNGVDFENDMTHEKTKSIKTTKDSIDYYLGVTDKDILTVFYDHTSMGVGFTVQCKLSIDIINNTNTACYNSNSTVVATTSDSSAYTTKTASGTLDLSQFDKNSIIKIDYYNESVQDIYGEVTESTVNDGFDETLGNWFDDILDILPQMLSSTNTGVTMKDIGFKKL